MSKDYIVISKEAVRKYLSLNQKCQLATIEEVVRQGLNKDGVPVREYMVFTKPASWEMSTKELERLKKTIGHAGTEWMRGIVDPPSPNQALVQGEVELVMDEVPLQGRKIVGSYQSIAVSKPILMQEGVPMPKDHIPEGSQSRPAHQEGQWEELGRTDILRDYKQGVCSNCTYYDGGKTGPFCEMGNDLVIGKSVLSCKDYEG